MSRLYTEDFESGTGAFTATFGSPSIVTTQQNSGTSSLRCNAVAAQTGFSKTVTTVPGTPNQHVYMRTYIYVATAPPTNPTTIMAWDDATTGTSSYFCIKMLANRTLIAGASGVTTGTASAAVPLNTWTRIEMDYDDGANTLKAYLDGTLWVSLTGTDLGGGSSACRFGIIGSAGNTTPTADIYYDDVAVNDTQGGSDNGLPGPVNTAVAVSGTDTGIGTEEAAIVGVVPTTETGTGTETNTLAVTLSDTDTGSGADTATISVADTDTASGTEAESVSQPTSDSDASGSADETGSVAASLSGADTAVETDTESVAAALAGTEAGSGSDTESIAAAISAEDTVTATDTEDVDELEITLGRLVHLDDQVEQAPAPSVSCTIPNDGSVVVGDLLLWVASIASGSRTFSVSGISNYTFAGSATQSGEGSHLWYKIVEAGDLGDTITLTPSIANTPLNMMLGKVSGADQTNPFDTLPQIASVGNLVGSSKTVPTLTSVAANSLEINIVTDARGTSNPNTTDWVAPSGITRQGQAFTGEANGRVSMAWGDSDAPVSGTVGGGVWTDLSAVGTAWILAVKAAESDETEPESSDNSANSSENQSIAATLSDPDTVAGIETQSLAFTDTDTGTSLELQEILAYIFSSDDSGSAESQSVDGEGSGPPPTPTLDNTLVQGPASLYVAAFGTEEPSDSSVASDPAGDWVDLGGSLGGVELTIEQEYQHIEFMQMPDTTFKRVKRRDIKIKMELAEPTLVNLAYVLNESAPVGEVFTPTAGRSEADVLPYKALIVRGWAPDFNGVGQHRRRSLVIRKALSTDSIVTKFSKDGQTTYSVTWSCHYVDESTKPFRIVDEV